VFAGAPSPRRLAPGGGTSPLIREHGQTPRACRRSSFGASRNAILPPISIRSLGANRRLTHAINEDKALTSSTSIYRRICPPNDSKLLQPEHCDPLVKMSKILKPVSLNDLPEEILVKIFRVLQDDRRALTSLRRACKTFCHLINDKLLTQSDCPAYRLKKGSCVQCFKIFTASRLKYARCNGFIVDLPLQWCCLNTFEALKQDLGTITELFLSYAGFNLITLSSLLNIMENVHRLRIDCFTSKNSLEAIKSAELPRPFNRTLSHLGVNYTGAPAQNDAESILLNFPAREICVVNMPSDRATWFEAYLFKHQEVVKYFTILIPTRDESRDQECVNNLRSLRFQVQYSDFSGFINGRRISKIKGFK
jgi:hypothetical protein